MSIRAAIVSIIVLVASVSYGAETTTMLIESTSAKLFTVVYPKQRAETVILLHGGPGVPMDFSRE